ncbi:MAG: hypothetical protein U0939_18660 [Pirellulales bacterium]
MRTLLCAVCRFAREEEAPTMVEYGILVAAIAILVGMSAHLLAGVVSEMFRDAAIVSQAR